VENPETNYCKDMFLGFRVTVFSSDTQQCALNDQAYDELPCVKD
jgi:hypothetical protein